MGKILAFFAFSWVALGQQFAPLFEIQAVQNGWVETAPVMRLEGGVLHSSPAELQYKEDSGGRSFLVFRVEAEGASALRLHLDNVRLPEGGKLYIYDWSPANGVNRVAGPFTGPGPMQSGEFWTPPIPGHTAVVELQLNEAMAELPFDVEQVEQLDGIDESASFQNILAPASLRGVSQRAVSLFRGVPLSHSVVDGMAILEGDIILGRAEELEPYTKTGERAAATLPTQYLWPGGVIPYAIDSALPNQTRITQAIDHWNQKMDGVVRLIRRTNESTYLNFVKADPAVCSSYLGKTSLAAQPVNIGDYCSVGNVIHEIGHATGLFHEHTRSDRDSFVEVRMANIQPEASYNFSIANVAQKPGAYDYGSVMHYGSFAFSANGKPTIVTIPEGIAIGQRTGLSAGDIAGVRSMYPAQTSSQQQKTLITITSNPPGRPVLVDNNRVSTPAKFQWEVGSRHSVIAPDSSESGTLFSFRSWSNGANRSNDFVTPASEGSLSADFTVQYQLNVAVTPAGRGVVSISPISGNNGMYPAGTNVVLTAKPGAGSCFSGWSGLLPIRDLSASVQMLKPYAVTAAFAPGNVTASLSKNPVAAARGQISANVNANTGCIWKATSRAPWITIDGTGQGTGSSPLRLNIEANTTGAARSGIVMVNSLTLTVTQTAR